MLIAHLFQLMRKLVFLDHGSNLRRPAATNWLLSLWFLATAMGILEGLTWARILTVFLPAGLAPAAWGVGAIWGVGIFLIDANFTTIDTAAGKHASSADARPQVRGWRQWFRNSVLMGTLIRLCIITFSMALTGPFLARNLDERQVTQKIAALNAATIGQHQSNVAAEHDKKIGAIDARLQKLRQEFVREVARGGRGPIAKAIETNIEAAERELTLARQARDTRLSALSNMTKDELRNEVELLSDNASTRTAIARQMEAEIASGDRILGLPASHVIASSLFLLLFLMMLVLKIYQPHAVTIYLDDTLQEAYERYIKGGFDSLPATVLAATDRSGSPSPMGASRFHAWYYQTYLPNHEAIAAAQAEEEGRAKQRARIDSLVIDRGELESRAHTNRAQLDAQQAALGEILAQKNFAAHQLETLEERMMEKEQQIRHGRLAKLQAEKASLAAERNRLAVSTQAMHKRATEGIPRELTEVTHALRALRSSYGVLDDGVLPACAQDDMKLAQLEVERIARIQEREQIDQALHQARIEIETLEHELERVGRDIGATVMRVDIVSQDRSDEMAFLSEELTECRRAQGDWSARLDTLQGQCEAQSQRVKDIEQACRSDREALREANEALRAARATADRPRLRPSF